MINTEVRDIARFYPVVCSMHHNRTQTAIIEAIFFGQWFVQPGIGQYNPSHIILTGDRYLYIRGCLKSFEQSNFMLIALP